MAILHVPCDFFKFKFDHFIVVYQLLKNKQSLFNSNKIMYDTSSFYNKMYSFFLTASWLFK